MFHSWDPRALEAYVSGGTKENPNTGEVELSCSPACEAAYYLGSASLEPLFPSLRNLQCPIADIVVGETSHHLETKELGSSVNFYEALREHLPQKVRDSSELIVAKDCGHFVVMEKPKLVASHLLRTIREVYNKPPEPGVSHL